MALDLAFSPELRTADGSVIRDRHDALRFVRDYRVRKPDEPSAQILQLLRCATTPRELEAAAQRFRSWVAHVERAARQ
jgi:hypothetical protein